MNFYFFLARVTTYLTRKCLHFQKRSSVQANKKHVVQLQAVTQNQILKIKTTLLNIVLKQITWILFTSCYKNTVPTSVISKENGT